MSPIHLSRTLLLGNDSILMTTTSKSCVYDSFWRYLYRHTEVCVYFWGVGEGEELAHFRWQVPQWRTTDRQLWRDLQVALQVCTETRKKQRGKYPPSSIQHYLMGIQWLIHQQKHKMIKFMRDESFPTLRNLLDTLYRKLHCILTVLCCYICTLLHNWFSWPLCYCKGVSWRTEVRMRC